MYDAFPDPYSYPSTGVLKNKLNIRDPESLEQFEAASFLQRAAEPLPGGRLGAAHYRAVHRHLFGDVYSWAGRYRKVRISRSGSVFCYPENIAAEMGRLFGRLNSERFLAGLPPPQFAIASAAFLATLNAIHPFRDGNGRCQLAFVALLASHAGHPLDVTRLDEAVFLDAMIRSFAGDEELLAEQIAALAIYS